MKKPDKKSKVRSGIKVKSLIRIGGVDPGGNSNRNLLKLRRTIARVVRKYAGQVRKAVGRG